jgi:natural product biosynthesis luciferase-like monooxygenase protein
MLYHHLSAPHSGVDVEQMVAVLREPLDSQALRQAWERLVNRHAVFRSTVEWEGRPRPVQMDRGPVRLPWEETDLRDFPSEERRRHLDDFLERDRRQGFDFHVAPLARARLFRTGDSEWTFVWTFHHILADGNCYPVLLREAFACYDALREGKETAHTPPRPFRDFAHWLDAHLVETRPRAEAFWRQALQGFTAGTPLPSLGSEPAGGVGVGEKELRLSAATTAALAAFARAHDLTMNTLVQGAWAILLGACGGGEDVVFGVTRSGRRVGPAGAEDIIGVLINSLPLRVRLASEFSVVDWLTTLRAGQTAMRDFEHTPLVDVQRWSEAPPGSPLFESLLVFTPRLIGAALREQGGAWTNRDIHFLEQTNYPLTLFAYGESELLFKLAYDRTRFSGGAAERCLEMLSTILEAFPEYAGRRLAELPLVSGRQKQTLLTDWNATAREYARDHCVHELIEAQVERTPHATAVVFRDGALSYLELNRRANQLARRLRSLGVGPGHFVGIFLKRSLDLPLAMLAVLKAGAAYLPLDPAYPRQRLGWMLEDTRAAVVLTQRDLTDALPTVPGQVVCLDEDGPAGWRAESPSNLERGAGPQDVAYVIFTSGSSGRPKGVLVEHRNVSNYFTAMDECLDFKEPGTWLAVTSISFDIHVQELLWTLARGFKVVIQEEPERSAGPVVRSEPGRKMEFSLFYFAADAGEAGQNRYRLLLEGARFADQNGFVAVWTPERHFHAFGGLYPNPSVTGAAIAAITSRVQIRAGSVVLPLHNPIRVAEEWSVVDNLSQGRVGLSFASGWHANDFALMPQNYRERKEIMLRGIDTVRRLWRGEAVPAQGGTGAEVPVRVFPPPVQADPPIWITSAGNVETFALAGQMGCNVLTNLLGQKPEELAEKLAAYRAALAKHGHAGRGHVTLMLHTFVGPDLEEVRRKVRGPFLDYLKTSTDLIQKTRWESPAFATRRNQQLQPLENGQLTDDEMRALMDHAFERYFTTSGLFGTPETCLDMVERLRALGVDEIACLIDFGVDGDSVLDSLRHLNTVRERSNPKEDGGDYSIPSQLRRHAVTHMQCTPSLARLLASEPDTLDALRPLRKLLVGGEALPSSLAGPLASALAGDLINVYGPTETTVWSTTSRIDRSGGPVTIGRPIANTQIYIVDKHLRLVPVGVAGELCIGGDGVTRGYLDRPELTAERFVPDPFGPNPAGRLYRTGDLARYSDDGRIEFLGRLDQQVKIRGYRIELGEIEAVLSGHPAAHECVVVAREQAGEPSLCAYVAARPSAAPADGTANPWRDLWDASYAGSADGLHRPADPSLNTAGWVSSYTGALIPDGEMREWAEATAERIRALKPRRVLEIGCGTGMLALRIAPGCERYHGVDFSPAALRYVEEQTARQGLTNLTLQQAAADELPGLDPGSFDVVVINSVIQYFPSVAYLVNVLEKVVGLMKDGGAIFVGDVRSLPLQRAFHTSVALAQAPADLPADEVRCRANQRLERDNELVLDPTLFRALPQHLPRIRRVEIQLKRGRSRNELTCFRYDVTLGVGGPPALAAPSLAEPGAGLTLSGVRDRLASHPAAVVFTGVPNPRVAQAVRAAELLAGDGCPETAGAVRERLDSAPEAGIDPEDLYALDVPYDVELTWSDLGPDRYDTIFRQSSLPAPSACPTDAVGQRRPWEEYANRRGGLTEPSALALELKDLARERLPEYMVPATVVVLDALPRTPNGKIDRKALPEPGRDVARTATAYVAPANELESTISSVWQELLQLERVGTQDNFFDLGANSLLMVQANSRLRSALGREVSLVELFRYPTVSALAAHLNRTGDDQTALRQSQERGRARLDALQRRRAVPRPGPSPS